jgi:hypothetical protein
VPTYQQFWTDKRASLTNESEGLINKYPDVFVRYRKPSHNTPVSVGESEELPTVIRSAEDNRETYCKALRGKPLYSVLYGAYTITLNDLNEVLKNSAPREEGFKEVRRRKRRNTVEAACTAKKAIPTSSTKVATKNFFAPFRTLTMDTYALGTESSEAEEPVPGKSSRPPPIVLTFAINLTELQKQLKGIAKQQFEIRSTRNGTRVTTKDMVDYQSVKGHFEANNLSTTPSTLNPKGPSRQ